MAAEFVKGCFGTPLIAIVGLGGVLNSLDTGVDFGLHWMYLYIKKISKQFSKKCQN